MNAPAAITPAPLPPLLVHAPEYKHGHPTGTIVRHLNVGLVAVSSNVLTAPDRPERGRGMTNVPEAVSAMILGGALVTIGALTPAGEGIFKAVAAPVGTLIMGMGLMGVCVGISPVARYRKAVSAWKDESRFVSQHPELMNLDKFPDDGHLDTVLDMVDDLERSAARIHNQSRKVLRPVLDHERAMLLVALRTVATYAATPIKSKAATQAAWTRVAEYSAYSEFVAGGSSAREGAAA